MAAAVEQRFEDAIAMLREATARERTPSLVDAGPGYDSICAQHWNDASETLRLAAAMAELPLPAAHAYAESCWHAGEKG